MRVAVHLGDLSPTDAGGYTFQDDVLKALLAVGGEFDCHFVLLTNSKLETLDALDPDRFSIERAPTDKSVRLARILSIVAGGIVFLWRALGVKTSLDRVLSRHQVDYVWFVTPYFAPTDFPYAYTTWDLQHRLQPWFPEVSSGGRWQYREKSYSEAISRAHFVIAPNAAGRDELQRFYGLPESRIRVLKHPTPGWALNRVPADKGHVNRKFGLKSGYLLYPAQFWPHKNHIGLLRAISVLDSQYGVQPELVLVGPDRSNLDHVQCEAGRLGLRDRVRCLGFVERADLAELYRDALLVPYVSYFGPENLPPLEAFALGCPVVAARVDGAAEQFGDAALLVDPSNPADIAEGIASVMQDEDLRKRLIAQGHQRAAAWTAQDYVRGVLKEIEKFSTVRAGWPS